MDNVLSTAEAARVCGMSTATMIRRFDEGKVQGYRLPGSGFRRIPREALVEFCRAYDLPLDFSNGSAKPIAAKADPAGRTGRSAVRKPARADAKRVLVVEDDEALAGIMVRALEKAGFEVKHAANGFRAGFLARSLRPDAIVLDIMLPGLDGREVCRLMRQDARLSATKIIAVTALSGERDKAEIFESGVDDFLGKPFALDELVWRVKKLLAAAPAEAQKVSSGAR